MSLNLLNDVLQNVGKLPNTQNIDVGRSLSKPLHLTKKISVKTLQWILLKEIGKPIIVANKEIPASSIQKILKKVLRNKINL